MGVDAGIFVEFKEEQFEETKGVITKTGTVNMTHIINLRNSKLKEIEIFVFDQLPKSTEEKVKVRLIKPVIKVFLVTHIEYKI